MRTPWSAAERQQLLEMAGDIPWPAVVSSYNAWAQAHGYPLRSSTAMRAACHRNGVPTGAIGRWVSAALIRRLLSIGDYQVRRWLRDGLVEHQRSGRRVFVSTQSLAQLAHSHTDPFAGRPLLTLLTLLDDEKLATQLAAMQRPVIRAKPVTCIETGQQFPSAAAAARWAHVTRGAIHLAVSGRRPSAGGYRFRYLDQEAS